MTSPRQERLLLIAWVSFNLSPSTYCEKQNNNNLKTYFKIIENWNASKLHFLRFSCLWKQTCDWESLSDPAKSTKLRIPWRISPVTELFPRIQSWKTLKTSIIFNKYGHINCRRRNKNSFFLTNVLNSLGNTCGFEKKKHLI